MLDRSKPTPSTYLVRAVPCNQSLHRCIDSLVDPMCMWEIIQLFNKHSGFKLHLFSDESNVKHIQTPTVVMLGAPSAKQIKQQHHDDTLQGCNLLIARAVFALVHCCCCYVAGAVILLILFLFLFLTHMQKICVLVVVSSLLLVVVVVVVVVVVSTVAQVPVYSKISLYTKRGQVRLWVGIPGQVYDISNLRCWKPFPKRCTDWKLADSF